MADEVANAVNETVAQDATTTAPATEETTSLEVVRDGPDLNPNDYRDTAETEAEADPAEADETEAEPQPGEPLTPKAQNRVQQAVNEKNEAIAQAKYLQEQLDSLKQREAQVVAEQELLGEVNPETGDYYTTQEIERIAFQQSRETEAQRLAEQRQSLEIQQNQITLNNEADKVIQDFPIFDPSSPEFKSEVAAKAAELLQENLVFDQSGQLLGSRISPYKLYQTVATAYNASAVPNQIKGQKATEQMLAAADNVTSSKPAKTSSADEKKMSAEEYAAAHGMNKVWQ